MTNKELYVLIEKIGDKADRDREIATKERHDLMLELSIFKGKSVGFLAALSLVFTLITNIGVAYLTKDQK